MHYVTECVITSSECAKLKDEMSAGRVLAGHMTSDQIASKLILKASREIA